MDRRLFLATAGASAAGLLLPTRPLAAAPGTGTLASAPPPDRLTRVGLELYAVRNAMKANPERTLAAIRKIGYTDVELLWTFNNFGQTTKELRDTLKREGLKAPCAHIAPEALLTEWERSLATAKALDHKYLIVPSLPPETNRSIDAWKLWANRFNVAGEVARRSGIWLALHNEPSHQKKLQGEVPIEAFANAIDPKAVRLQLDCGNMLMGGGDPMDFLSRHRAKCWSFHLKNVVADRSADTELGQGTFDLRAFLSAIPEIDKKPCFVEQEGAADELAAAARNFQFVSALRW